MLSAIAIIAISSCKKSSPQVEEEPIQTVIKLPDSITIGTQKWTTVNYNGDGGLNYDSSPINNPTVGKFYTLQEAKAFILPKGWRVPSADDYAKLCVFAGSKFKDANGYPDNDAQVTSRFMATSGWSLDALIGKNSIGFNAVPTGYYYDGGFTGNASSSQPITSFLTTTASQSLSGGVINFSIYKNSSSPPAFSVFGTFQIPSKARASLRFVKDI